MCVNSFSLCVQSFVDSIAFLYPVVFSCFQDIVISKNLFQYKNPHISVGMAWQSKVLIELVVVYKVPIVI